MAGRELEEELKGRGKRRRTNAEEWLKATQDRAYLFFWGGVGKKEKEDDGKENTPRSPARLALPFFSGEGMGKRRRKVHSGGLAVATMIGKSHFLSPLLLLLLGTGSHDINFLFLLTEYSVKEAAVFLDSFSL